jgi:hypothetical protein
VHVALGNNSTFIGNVQAGIHLDRIMLEPTMFFDERIVIKDGAWTI